MTELLYLVPWVGLVLMAHRAVTDNSFLWHVRAGSSQLATGHVLTTDPFSFTFRGTPWRTQSWLADLLYGRLEGWFGLGFVPWLVLAAAALTLLFVGIATFRRTGSRRAVVVGLVLATWLGSGYFAPRPVLISFVLLSMVVLALDIPGGRWALPLIIWIWAAVHASFVVGIALILLEGLRTRDRRRLADAAGSVVAASVTAHGPVIWLVLVDFIRNRGALQLIVEWAPPELLEPDQLPYLLALASLVVASAKGRLTPRDLWVPLPFALFGLTSTRALFPAMIVVLPWALRALPEPSAAPRAAGAGSSPIQAALNWSMAAAILLLPVALVSFPGLSESRFPVAAAAGLADVPTFHDDVTGGYLILEGRDVYVDDRAELYGREFFVEFISIRNALPGWEEGLEAHGIRQALLRESDALAAALPQEGWQETYRDEDFVVFAKP